MPSPKAADLRRDSRCILHSAITDVTGRDGEFKVSGRVGAVTGRRATEAKDAWWHGRPAEQYRLYALVIEEAVGSPGTRPVAA